MAATRSQSLLKEAMMNETNEFLESRLENLKETIDDPNVKIGERIHALLLLLRSKHSEGENPQVDSIPTSPQLPESRDVNRPEPKPNYVINSTADVSKASSMLPNRTIKCHRRISLEEIEERRLKGLCMFCEESETPDHYLRHKNLGILMIDCDEDQSCDDEELVETEVGTESMETEQGKEELIPQFQVHVSKLEHGLQIHNELPTVSVNSQDVVGCDELCEHQRALLQVSHVKARDELLMKSTDVTNNQAAHYLFDKMPLRVQSMRRHIKCHKTWRFKFKAQVQPRQLIHEKLGVHEANATKNQWRSPTGLVVDDLHGCGNDILCIQYFVSSVVAGDLQETQWLFNDELQDIKKFQIVIEEDSNAYVYQEFNGMRIRSHMFHHQRKPSKSPKSWKFKFKSENLRKMEVNSVLEIREVVVDVVERIRQVMSVTKNFPTRQLFGKKFKDKGRLKWKKRRKALKSWRFKFKNRDLMGYNLSGVKLLFCFGIHNRSLKTALIEVRPPELFVAERMITTKVETEEDMKENDQKQQGDWGHYCLLVAAANWSPQMNLWSTSDHVWHRWKARYCFVGIISTMWAWLFGEEGFDIVKRSDELNDTWTGQIRSLNQWPGLIAAQDCGGKR